jgi:hypothetical protein
MVKEICSPISRPGSKVGAINQSHPEHSAARAVQVARVSAQPSHAHVSLSEAGQPDEVTIVSPSPED